MQIVSRKQAKALGLSHYFTGKPCKRGHLSKRRVDSAGCVECVRVVSNMHYADNRDETLKRHKRWREENKERSSAYFKEYRKLNPEWDAERHKRYHRENRIKRSIAASQRYKERREEILKKNAEWRKQNPEKAASIWRNRRAREANAEGFHTAEDVLSILKDQDMSCAGCGCDISKEYHVDHIMPISKGGSNWPDNLQCLCAPCNLTKHAKLPEQWLMEIQQNGD